MSLARVAIGENIVVSPALMARLGLWNTPRGGSGVVTTTRKFPVPLHRSFRDHLLVLNETHCLCRPVKPLILLIISDVNVRMRETEEGGGWLILICFCCGRTVKTWEVRLLLASRTNKTRVINKDSNLLSWTVAWRDIWEEFMMLQLLELRQHSG